MDPSQEIEDLVEYPVEDLHEDLREDPIEEIVNKPNVKIVKKKSDLTQPSSSSLVAAKSSSVASSSVSSSSVVSSSVVSSTAVSSSAVSSSAVSSTGTSSNVSSSTAVSSTVLSSSVSSSSAVSSTGASSNVSSSIGASSNVSSSSVLSQPTKAKKSNRAPRRTSAEIIAQSLDLKDIFEIKLIDKIFMVLENKDNKLRITFGNYEYPNVLVFYTKPVDDVKNAYCKNGCIYIHGLPKINLNTQTSCSDLNRHHRCQQFLGEMIKFAISHKISYN